MPEVPSGMFTEASLLRGMTLGDLIARQARMFPDLPAFSTGADSTSHRQHQQRVLQLAAGLHQAGVGRGDCVAVLAQNSRGFVELLAAAAHLGALVSLLNWRLVAGEVAALLDNDDPMLVFVDDALRPLLPTVPRQEIVAIADAGAGDNGRCLADFFLDTAQAPAPAADSGNPLLLVHTASTDGRPKAAMLSHGNLIANALQLQALWRLGPDDVHLCCLPLFHITAISLLLATQLAGGCSLLAPRFDAAAALQDIRHKRVTLFAEFAPMLDGLLDASGSDPAPLASLRHVCGLDTPATIARFEAVCPGATFWAGYGQTETSGLLAAGPFRDAPGAVGFPLPLCRVEIVDDDGMAVLPGEVGEIVVRGPTVFLGYRGRADDNAQTFRANWLHTGDSGRFDADGRLCFSGRLASKALIKTGGENVYPAEVEAALRQHPDIVDAVVFGVPDAQWGEAVVAVCATRPGTAPDEATLIAFVAERIARYKRPRRVVCVATLPRGAGGRPDRQRIRELYGAVQASFAASLAALASPAGPV